MLISAEKRLMSRCWRPIVSAAFSQNNQQTPDDHYKTLGVRKGASLEDIKHAYRDLSKKYHPDVCKDHDSEERFKKISLAYNTLKTAIKEGRFGSNTFYNDGKRKDYEQAGSTTTTYKYKSASSQARSNTTSSRSTTYSKPAEEEEVKSRDYDEIYKEWEKNHEKGDEMLYERIFKKTFKEDPAYFYKAENAHLRKEFEEEMAKRRAERGQDIDDSDAEWERNRGWDPESEAARKEYSEEHRRYDGSRSAGAASMQFEGSQNTSGANDQTRKILAASLALCTGLIGYMLTHERNKSNAIFEKSKNLASDDLDKVRDNFLKREEEKKEKLRTEFQDSLALMKKYPRRNPNAIVMLVDYTIWNDLKLFSVPWTYFHGQDEDLTEKTNDFEKNRIHNIKLNTSLTLALESERVLKNVFVKVDDVMKSLQETGHYEAPGVFFRYYGYIYLKIRRKPIVAENLKECLDNKEKYISVFDLYFKYSTPILMANNEYYEIPLKHHAFIKDTTTREGLGWVGSAHVNHRPIEKKFYNGEDKNVFMWKGPVETTFAQQRYLRAWGVHYPVYQKT